MKTYSFIILLAAALIFGMPADAECEQEKEGHVKVSPGMELKKFGGAYRLVPKDIRLTEKDGLVTTESMGEYVTRRFLSVEDRIDAIEARLSGVEEALKKVGTGIDAIREKQAEAAAAIEPEDTQAP